MEKCDNITALVKWDIFVIFLIGLRTDRLDRIGSRADEIFEIEVDDNTFKRGKEGLDIRWRVAKKSLEKTIIG